MRIDSLPGAGTLKLDGTALSGVTTVSVADISAGKLTYQAAANANGKRWVVTTSTLRPRDADRGRDGTASVVLLGVSKVCQRKPGPAVKDC